MLLAFSAGAQKNVRLNVVCSNEANKIIKKSHVAKYYNSKEDAVSGARELLYNLYGQGYLTANIDSIKADSLKINVFLYVGEKYTYQSLRKGNLDKYLANEINFKESNFDGKHFDYNDLLKTSEKLLSYCENNGYPFAEFKLDSVKVSGDKIDAAICFNKNNKITVDSIILKGNSKLARGYLYNYLSVKPGNIYNESLISRIDKKLRDLPFVNVVKPCEILFTENNAKVFLYLDKKKASSFYGIIGVLPNNQTTGKILINGELKLTLLNSFGRGELIDLNWRSISKGTQDLKIALSYPFLFATPFGINYKFTLFKQDTTYITLNHNIGIQYYFSGNNFLKVFAEIYSSDLLSGSGLETLTVLPDYADISSNLFGIEASRENFDYRLNPRKGYLLHFSGAGGIKKIKKNSSINSALYDSIRLKSSQFKFLINGKLFVPLFRKMTILFNSDNGYVINNTIFENELFKLGGLNSLRGFDEESIRVSYFNLLSCEFRYLFERNSFAALFFNAAYYEKNTYNSFVHDIPYGFGAGVSFDSKIGMFSIYYALGSQFGQPVLFKQSKIHFGYTNNF